MHTKYTDSITAGTCTHEKQFLSSSFLKVLYVVSKQHKMMDVYETSEDDKTYEAPSSEDGSLSSLSSIDKSTESDLSLTGNQTEQNIFPSRSDLILICSICLGIQSDDTNEIIFCDKCGCTVHEDCYGVNTTCHRDVSASFPTQNNNCSPSSDSDDPTELWFCESCVSDHCLPLGCELCPNIGNVGLYKMTDQKRWVHMICALFNKYVTFHDTDIMWPVDLSDIPQSTFGEKVCSYCEDIRMSRTGICISCEVGLCKTSAHVGCAYRNGLIHFNNQSLLDALLKYQATLSLNSCWIHRDTFSESTGKSIPVLLALVMT
ncbi:hypothetical protein GJ496_010157 [Pomphorhynchus laevis]|nr:hypothetical protein GJ496_010157 [Pomphorhynchus laevis]